MSKIKLYQGISIRFSNQKKKYEMKKKILIHLLENKRSNAVKKHYFLNYENKCRKIGITQLLYGHYWLFHLIDTTDKWVNYSGKYNICFLLPIYIPIFPNINWKKFWKCRSKRGGKLLRYLDELYGSEFLCLRLLAERTRPAAHPRSGECLHSERRSDPLPEYVSSVWPKWGSQRALTLRNNFLGFTHNSVSSQCASEYWCKK